MTDIIVVTTEADPQQIEIISEGPQGPQGPTGPKGDVGDVNPAMNTILADAQAARDAALSAETAAEAAQAAAQTAQTAAETAQTGAETAAATATTKAGEASSSASSASTSASTATTQAGAASTSASNAATSASTATTQAGIATTQAGAAATSASNAATSASAALASKNAAATSETNAAASASTASTKASDANASAVNAANSASTATTQATAAASSASAAATSASNASGHASTAAAQAVAAASSATSASGSATSAANSATAAANSATSAATQAINSATSAAASATSASNSASSAGAAAGSVAQAQSLYGDATALQAAVQNAASQASLAQGYAASAASVVQQDLSGVTAAALHRSPNAITTLAIYDTSKDSDGGAWTKKCQQTSWYNEALAGRWLGAQDSEFQARNSGATVSSTELTTNGDFASSSANWTGANLGSGAIAAWSSNFGGSLALPRTDASNNARVYQNITTVSGKTYRVTFDVKTADGVIVAVGTTNAGTEILAATNIFGNRTASFVFVATGATSSLSLRGQVNGATAYVDNVSVREVTALNTTSNDYFQLTTDGKFYRLWKNWMSYSEGALATFSSVSNVTQAATSISGFQNSLFYGDNSVDRTAYKSVSGQAILAGGSETYSFYIQMDDGLAPTTDDFDVIVRGGGGIDGVVIQAVAAPIYRVSRTRTYASGSAAQNALYGPRKQTTTSARSFRVSGHQIEYGAAPTSYEAKNTASEGTSEIFRGNKAEFPKQAAIIAENNSINIYDLTEPGRPMWMRFVSAGSTGLFNSGYSIATLSAQNGVLCGGQPTVGLRTINFASDRVFGYRQATASTYQGQFLGGIADRNGTLLFDQSVPSGGTIVNSTVNAVAMTVLPDAPIDPATGLRVPTIAVATAGGASVIKHNGTVVNSASTSSMRNISIAQGLLYADLGSGAEAVQSRKLTSDLASSFAFDQTYRRDTGEVGTWFPRLGSSAQKNYIQPTAKGIALSSVGSNTAQLLVAGSKIDSTQSKGLATKIANTYNTGWMAGDIRRCYLSDAAVESVNGAELVTNGTFTTDTTGWSVLAGDETLSVVSGRLRVTYGPDGATGSTTGAYQVVSGLTVGKNYVLRVGARYKGTNGAVGVGITQGLGTAQIVALYGLNDGTNESASFVATATSMYVRVYGGYGTTGTYVEADDISIKEAVYDRSYKASYAALTGVLTKAQLASGTSLVGYSGFSAANYLRESYSADLDFGTGEWTASAWVNVPAAMADNSFPVVGSELVNTAAWSAYGTGVSYSAGVFTFDGVTSLPNIVLSTNTPLAAIVAGRAYKVTYRIVTGTTLPIGIDIGGTLGTSRTAAGTYTEFIIAANTTGPQLRARDNTGARTGSIDSISVVEVDEACIFDRAHSSGARLRMGVDCRGRLVAEAFDGTTTRTVTTSASYNTATWLKAEANYTTDGSLVLSVNGREVARTVGTPLLTLNSRYNLILRSEEFDNASWTKSGVTITANSDTAPDATTTADKIIAANNASTTRTAYQSVTFVSGSTYTYSVYVKAAGYTKVALNELGSGRFGASFDLVAVTATSVGGAGYVSSAITDAGSGWYRCSVTFTAGSTSHAPAVVGYPTGATVTASGVAYAGNGVDGIIAWGAQVEIGSSATTYQRVAATAETNVAPLTIGNSYAADAPFPGTIALLKLGATVPTNEQGQFMYEQEKQLFRAGAQSVLPDAGSIVDMAYDDATDRWVAVSAANESYWTGLVRNSVTAVPAGSYTKVMAGSGLELVARSTTNPGVDVSIPAYGLREELVRRAEAAARLGKEQVAYDYVGGFTGNTTSGSTAIASVAGLSYPTSYIGAQISGSGIPTGTTIVAVSGTTIYLSAAATATATGVSVTFLDFKLPAGMEAKEVATAGAIKQEGSTKDYTRLYDGFIETIRFGSAPGVTAWVQIKAQRITLQ